MVVVAVASVLVVISVAVVNLELNFSFVLTFSSHLYLSTQIQNRSWEVRISIAKFIFTIKDEEQGGNIIRRYH